MPRFWTVLRRGPGRGRSEWLCRCRCGVQRLVLGASLRGGHWPGGSICAKIYGKGAFRGPMDQRCATTAHR
jgi:hypothetical protein